MSSQIKKIVLSAVFISFLFTANAHGTTLSVSTEVQANIKTLTETKSCPGCDLKGANLNRLELEGANLEGANLSRAKLFLTNLADANLANCNLSEAEFGGADLANADLRGANLTATSFAGAYLVGTKLDGEMVSTKPYASADISEIEEDVYVEDTVKPKANPSTDDINIGSRRDFEETSQEVIVETPQNEITPETVQPPTESSSEETLVAEEIVQANIPEVSSTPPGPKTVPAIQEVLIEEDALETVAEQEDKKTDELFATEHVTSASVVPMQDKNIEHSEKNIPEEELVAVVAHDSSLEETQEVELEKLDTAHNEEQSAIVEEAALAIENVSDSSVEGDEKPGTDQQAATGYLAATDLDDKQMEEVAEGQTNIGTREEDLVQQVEAEELQEESSTPSEPERVSNEIAEVIEPVQETAKILPAIEEIQTLSKEVYSNMERLLDENKCYGCDLTEVNLSGENLDSADLEGAILVNAILTGTDLEEANLKGAVLKGADLSDSDLSEADLYKADLTGADLTGAKLEGTLLDDADLSGVKGYQPAIPLFPGQ